MFEETTKAGELHARVAESHIGTPCHITEWNEYPYECVAKDKKPGANVVICEAHNAWWTESVEHRANE